MPVSPPVSLPTTLSFQPRASSRSTFGAPNAMPCSASAFVSSIDRRDVQQRLRRDAADVETYAAERRVALDQHRLHAEIGGAERGAVAAGPGSRARASRIRCRRCPCRFRRVRPSPPAAPASPGEESLRGSLASKLPPGLSRRAPVPAGTGSGCGSGWGARCRARSFERQHQRALAHLVADLDARLLSPCPRPARARPSSPCRIRA